MMKREEIIQKINQIVEKSEYARFYKQPIVGFADAKDPLYEELDEIIQVKQMRPEELLASAKTVIVFFLPFSKYLMEKVQNGHTIVQAWSHAYQITNELLAQIQKEVMAELAKEGYEVCGEPPTMNYDPINLTAKWSHKSSAVIAGIGTFGLNRLLITREGTAGRLNSLVTSASFEPTKRPDRSYCLYFQTGKCKVCVKNCPSGALTTNGFDRFRCNAYLDGKNIHDWEQGCSICSRGPCAMKGF